MKEFVLSPPAAILYLAGGVLLVALASIFLKKGERARKAIGIGIVVVVVVGIIVFAYRPVRITVDEEGLAVSGAGGVELAWQEIDSALFEPNLPASEYRPSVRTRGIALGDYRTGRFLLSNRDPARVFMERSDAAVVIRTDDLTYLLAPQDVEGLASAIDELRVYEGEESR